MLAPVRFSDLKFIARSPKHYKARLAKADVVSAAAERAMRFGTAAHRLILEPQRTDLVVFDGKTRRGKAWDACKTANADKLILKPSELERAQACAREVLGNTIATPWLVGHHEHELRTWDFAGRPCGGRPDVVGHDFIADVKTSADISPSWFVRAALRMCYHGQLAWYLEGAAREFGRPYTRAAIIAVETKPPYDVIVYPLTSAAIEQGQKICHSWMEKLLSAEATGIWHGQALAEVPLDVPSEEIGFDFGEDDAEDEEEAA